MFILIRLFYFSVTMTSFFYYYFALVFALYILSVIMCSYEIFFFVFQFDTSIIQRNINLIFVRSHVWNDCGKKDILYMRIIIRRFSSEVLAAANSYFYTKKWGYALEFNCRPETKPRSTMHCVRENTGIPAVVETTFLAIWAITAAFQCNFQLISCRPFPWKHKSISTI